MTLSLRAKLVAIVGAAAACFVVAIAIFVRLAWQQSDNLDDLEQRLVPKLELQPRLRAQFEQLGQGLKDGVAAQDRAAVEGTSQIVESMFALIAAARGALDPGAGEDMREALGAYHRSAVNVSLRLLDGETGEDLVLAMDAMQAKHQLATEVIERTTRLDRGSLRSGFETLHQSTRMAGRYGLGVGVLSIALVAGLSIWLGRGALQSLESITQGFARFARGKFDQPIVTSSSDELGKLAQEANQMATALAQFILGRDTADWIKAGQVELSHCLRGDLEPEQAARAAIVFLAQRVDAVAGAAYLIGGDGSLELAGTYALASGSRGGEATRRFRPGEGLVGEAAFEDELRVVTAVPKGYLGIVSGLGQADPACLVLLPLRRAERVIGVLELALFKPCSDEAREFLGRVRESLAAAFESAKSRARLRDLLEESQTLAARLSAQEEELVQNNGELVAQQEELRLANDELEMQRASLRLRNGELERARTSLQEKADELSKVSSYKSQFLANMSHELRTPLNSMLLLSQILSDNDAGNLSPKQVEHCRTIYSAGKGLLNLINQVLDLSKIEAGKQELCATRLSISEMVEHLSKSFEPQFASKGLALSVQRSPEAPQAIQIDGQCLQRILINLLGNALKFTERGAVTLRVMRPAPETRFERPELTAGTCVAFSVTDTGVGIPAEVQARIFARFEQADARTARRYGGTGLGLSIARESAWLMGGELRVESVEGEGSTFTCFVPDTPPADVVPVLGQLPASALPPASSSVPDDRDVLLLDEPHLLIIEDDPVFATQLVETVRRLRLKALYASSGREGILLAQTRRPAGIVLDVRLPDIDGFTVREELRKDPITASIPIHFVSAFSAPAGSLGQGAVGYLTKPATREALVEAIQTLIVPQSVASARVLIVEDDPDQSDSVAELLLQSGLEAHQARTGDEATRALQKERFGCLVLDLGLPDVDGLQFLESLQQRTDISLPAVVVHTARALSREETRRIRDYAQAVVLKDGRSAERLVDEVRLFAGKLRDTLPRRVPVGGGLPPGSDVTLEGTKVLIADDDMRTVYALSALLRGKGADVVVAETGREALRVLEEHSNVQLVLMDIMMPDMDGYEVMRRLRQQARYADLPVIALTARAMKGERERCKDAGASDYMAKPLDPAGVLSTLKHWLSPKPPLDVAS